MQTINFDKFKTMVPSKTYDYVYRLLRYLDNNDSIDVAGRYIYEEADKTLFRSLKAYQDTPEGKGLLSSIGFTNEYRMKDDIYSFEQTFAKYYKYIMPFEKEEEYLALTPEDILLRILSFNDSDSRTLGMIRVKPRTFINKLAAAREEKIEEIIEAYENQYFTKCTISLVNYFNTVSKIYNYLDPRREFIKNIKPTDENLKAISYLLGLFYYDNVAYGKNLFDEKQAILDYLKTLGITSEKIEENIGINMSKMDSKPSILTLKSNLDIDIVNRISSNDLNVGGVFYNVVNAAYNDNQSFKYLFGLLGVSGTDVLKFYSHVTTLAKEYNNDEYQEIYKGLLPETTKLLDRFIKIYTYLINEKKLDRTYVTSAQDYVALSVLISSYIDGANVSKYLSSNGLSFSKLLEILNLPAIDELLKNIESQKVNPRLVTKFKRYIYNGYPTNKSKNEITPSLMYRNLHDKDYSESTVVNKLFYSVSKSMLPNDFDGRVKSYIEKEEESKQLEIRERLFKDIDIEVYNYLVIVYSYFCIFRNKVASIEDARQLSIIYAACRYNEKLNNYLESIGVTRSKISKAFNMDINYETKKLDVEELEREFSKYVFDRDPDKISVYSIFENAFVPELTNSVRLRQALHEMGKEPEDFLGIEKQLADYDKKLEEDKKQKAIDELFAKVNAKETNRNVLVLYDFLRTKVKGNELLTCDKDCKEMALIIANLMPDNSHAKFFEMYGVTLEYVLSLIGLEPSDISLILKNKCNDELINDFKTYFGQASYVNINSYAHYAINSDLIKKIAKDLDISYDQLSESVLKEKKRRLSPKEELSKLNEEVVPPVDKSSFSSLARYGDSLSSHSLVINSSLSSLMNSGSISTSVKRINDALDSLVIVEKEEPKKLGFWESMFALPEPPKVTKRYDYTKIGELQEAIDSQLEVLSSELSDFEYIRTSLEVLLQKTLKQLEELRKVAEEPMPEQEQTNDDYTFPDTLNRNTRKTLLENKISALETTKTLIERELFAVHTAITNHSVTINALSMSKNVLMPVLGIEMAINKGNRTESNALDLTSNLLGLVQGVVNNNEELTKANLNQLRAVSESDTLYARLGTEVQRYLESAKTAHSLEEPKQEETSSGPRLTLDPPDKM